MIYDEIWIDVNKFQSGYAIAARRNEEQAQIKIIVTNDGKKISNSSFTLKFLGNNPVGDLTGGAATRVSGEEGAYLYTFTKENLAVSGKFKLAYFELYDSSNKKITSSDVQFRVIDEADMSADQATIHITLLDEMLDKHDTELSNQKQEFDEYSNQQKDEWGNFIDSNREIIESVDPGGKVLTEIIDSRTDLDQTKFPSLADRLNSQLGSLSEFRDEQSLIQKMAHEFAERGANVRWYGAKGDGITDDTVAINQALSENRIVLFPQGIYRVTDTINLKQNRTIMGVSPSTRGYYDHSATILYDGIKDEKKAVIVLGKTNVTESPNNDGSDVIFKNMKVDCNNKAGVGIFGMYLTNESIVSDVTIQNSLLYNLYIAKTWYFKIQNVTSMHCKNIGIALGIPLLIGDTTYYESTDELQMNSVICENLRSFKSGSIYSDKEKVFMLETDFNKGYGIGIGVGFSLTLSDFTSEQSGGANLYVYCRNEANKFIEKGYLEKTAVNSGYANAVAPGVVINNQGSQTFNVEVRDVFINVNNGGGIYHRGEKSKMWLKNVFYPAFLKSLDGVSTNELYSYVLKDKVYHLAGTYNTDPSAFMIDNVTTVNSRYSFKIDMNIEGLTKMVYVKTVNGKRPWGSLLYVKSDGTTTAVAIPSTANDEEFTLVGTAQIAVTSIQKGGVTGDEDRNMIIKVVALKPTYY